MINAASVLVCVASLVVPATIAAQSPQPSRQSPSVATDQQRQRQNASSSRGQSITILGCVYEASDQPGMLALKGINDVAGQNTPAATSGGGTPDPQARSDTDRAISTPAPTGTSATLQNVGGAWYRLMPGSTATLKSLVGQRVQISGRVKPGRDGRGAAVMTHRLDPDKAMVTASDLQPAPELDVMSVQPMDGSCVIEP
jgi:hypothetical protein